jgi:hypothetical protein
MYREVFFVVETGVTDLASDKPFWVFLRLMPNQVSARAEQLFAGFTLMKTWCIWSRRTIFLLVLCSDMLDHVAD